MCAAVRWPMKHPAKSPWPMVVLIIGTGAVLVLAHAKPDDIIEVMLLGACFLIGKELGEL